MAKDTVETVASKDRINEFRKVYPLRQMRIQAANNDELKQMRSEDGMLDLESCSFDQLASHGVVAEPPVSREDAHEDRYLWAVRGNDFPVALEKCGWGGNLESKMIKHSNLTGGMPAHSGGEVWVVKDQGLLVNASSGRFGADNPEELAALVEALRGLGFRVGSMGFDIDNPTKPNAIQVGPVDWRDPYE